MRKFISVFLVCMLISAMQCSAHAAVESALSFVQPEILESGIGEEPPAPEQEALFCKTESSYNSCLLLENDVCSVQLVEADFEREEGWSIAIRCENNGKEELRFSWANTCTAGDDTVNLWEDETTVPPGKMRQLGILTSEAEEADLFEISVSVAEGEEIIAEAAAVIQPAYGRTYIMEEDSSPVVVDFDGLLERNSEVCGWLYSPNTVISYPVVQTDNNSKYLHKDIDLNYSSYGMLFAETNSERNFNNDNNIIYGHHMNDGSMFASIVNYARQNYYEKHPVLYLNTPEINYRVDIFAAFLTDMYSDVYIPNFPTDGEMQAWLDAAVEQSAIETDVAVAPGDKILTLSTCTYEYDTARYVVLGRMAPIL